jgi:hypothetical protein
MQGSDPRRLVAVSMARNRRRHAVRQRTGRYAAFDRESCLLPGDFGIAGFELARAGTVANGIDAGKRGLE